MVKAGVVGATGYAGNELVRLLFGHPEVTVHALSSHSYVGQSFADVYENYRGVTDAICIEEDLEKMAAECDVLFMALPHGKALEKITPKLLDRCKIIDLGGDFRLQDKAVYEQWYGLSHNKPEVLQEAVYGLCELKREDIKNARMIANPGCYTTCSILSLAPVVKKQLVDLKSIVIDAKSGVSGAGRSLSLGSLYTECNENMKAYKLASHRHTPEIEQELSLLADTPVALTFTPHLTPMNRGILATIYATLSPGVTEEGVRNAFEEFYSDAYFVRLTAKGKFPETRWVKGSNFVDIGFTIDERCGRIIIVGALDNLVKGAAGQAVQNMNIAFGLEENTGLLGIPMFPV